VAASPSGHTFGGWRTRAGFRRNGRGEAARVSLVTNSHRLSSILVTRNHSKNKAKLAFVTIVTCARGEQKAILLYTISLYLPWLSLYRKSLK
jgi:hypothetical protein